MYAVNMPPKNMISVTRNIHIPSVEASFCCSAVSNWWSSALVLDTLGSFPGIIIGGLVHHGLYREIIGGRRRGRFPFQSLGSPRIRRSAISPFQRPKEVGHRQS